MAVGDWRGRRVLVTGASAGLGWEFARQFAAGGALPILAARREARLQELATEIRRDFNAPCEVFPVDLAGDDGPRYLAEQASRHGVVDALINNAGVGAHGEFSREDPDGQRRMIRLNVEAPVRLTRLLVGPMLAQKRGLIVNVASTAAFRPVPRHATYSATKVFLLHWSRAIRGDLAKEGVTVVCICPGVTETEFFQAGNYPANLRMFSLPMMKAEVAVRIAMKAIKKGQAVKVLGFRNWLLTAASKLLPDFVRLPLAERIMSE